MKKILLFSLLLAVLLSCNKGSTPKETAQTFIKALSASDLTTASDLVSADTKAVLDKAKKETNGNANAEESFSLASLTETVSEKNAEVKNEIIVVPMVKENDGWKVVLNESLLNQVQGRDEMLSAAKNKWEALVKEYDGRLVVVKQYISYKQGMGAMTPKLAQLKVAVESLKPQQAWTKESIIAYVQKQQALDKTIDAAMEPSLAANTDLSLNYIVQISNASDRIKAAKAEYQSISEQAHSPVYAPLPISSISPIQVSN